MGLNGTTAGTQYDQLNVTGTVALGGATLSVPLGFTPTPGSQFNIITGASSVTGTFAQGSSIVLGGSTYSILYPSTGGKAVTLVAQSTVVGTPQIDDGTMQRSMVRSITLTFNSSIASTLSSVMATLSLTRASDNLSVGLKGTLDSSGTVLTLTFTGSSIIGTSLADGRYTLAYGSTTLLSTAQLWRLFGDLYGTASVTAADKTAFMAAMNTRKGMSTYSAYLDYNEDGIIVNADQTAFTQRYGTSI